jgi:predicted RNA-binding Zn-ribbon protein involved in translation (DUF1610 family)
MTTMQTKIWLLQEMADQLRQGTETLESRFRQTLVDTLSAMASAIEPKKTLPEQQPKNELAFVCPICGEPIQSDKINARSESPLSCPNCGEAIMIVNEDFRF